MAKQGEGRAVSSPDKRPATKHHASPKTTLTAACLLLLAVAGCGGGEGVAQGATVTAYVEAPLCAEARQELAREQGKAGDVQVRVICLESPQNGSKLNLATVGANARRATEDSTTVVYLEPPEPAAARFTHPILESAEIAWISNGSGKAAMARLLRAIRDAGSSGSLRASVADELH